MLVGTPSSSAIADARAACLQIREFPRRFVFNANLDGVLSAHLLKRRLVWQPVGASACSGLQTDCLWLAEGPLGKDLVFIDLWAAQSEYALQRPRDETKLAKAPSPSVGGRSS